MKTQIVNIKPAASTVEWIGRKVTGAHNGTIDLKEGQLNFSDNVLTGGRIVIDTPSIKILDVTDPATNTQFAGHLASDDFFNTENYPEAVLDITLAEPRENGSYRVTGNLTIKGITHPASFELQLGHSNTATSASGTVSIDRTLYGIKFRSGNFFQNLGDNLIYNNFDLHFKLIAETAASADLA